MITERIRTLQNSLRIADIVVLIAVWLGAFTLRFSGWPVSVYHGVPRFLDYCWVAALIPVVWGPVARVAGLYATPVGLRGQFFTILKSTALTSLALVAIAHFLAKLSLSRVLVVFFCVIGSLALWMLRKGIQVVQARRARGAQPNRCLIVGTGDLARKVYRTVQEHPELQLTVSGYVGLNEDDVGRQFDNLPVTGQVAQIRALIRSERAAGLLVALPVTAGVQLDQLLCDLHDELVHITIVPDVFRYSGARATVSTFADLPMMSLTTSPMSGVAGIFKRVTDICVSLALLVVLAPLLGLIALLIKRSSPGPVFYVQERMGLGCQAFRLVKFRTMKVDAERTTGPVWAKHDDPRCTPIGSFLRRTSLDELPQLCQVLKGKMSLVGPRPERMIFVEKFRHSVPRYMLRHRVKAGMTGWAQVNGWRGDTSINERVACDLEYIRNWSLSFDFKILGMTLLRGFQGARSARGTASVSAMRRPAVTRHDSARVQGSGAVAAQPLRGRSSELRDRQLPENAKSGPAARRPRSHRVARSRERLQASVDSETRHSG